MSFNTANPNSNAYGLEQALVKIMPAPISSTRNPTTHDKAQRGQMWINSTTGIAFIMTKITANHYTWYATAQAAVSYTAAGALSAGTTLTVTGASTLTGGASIGTGLTVTAGGAGVTGGITAATGNIATTVGNITSAGSITAATTLTVTGLSALDGGAMVGTSILVSDNITAVLGNITAAAGDLIISTATKGITLPGPVRIITGAGVPANGLALEKGDLYINTTGATGATRIYVASGVGSWVNVTCSA